MLPHTALVGLLLLVRLIDRLHILLLTLVQIAPAGHGVLLLLYQPGPAGKQMLLYQAIKELSIILVDRMRLDFEHLARTSIDLTQPYPTSRITLIERSIERRKVRQVVIVEPKQDVH